MGSPQFHLLKRIGDVGEYAKNIIGSYQLILNWAVGFSDHNLNLIEQVLETSLKIVPKVDGIIILEADPDGWALNGYVGDYFHVAAVWPKEDKHLFPSWIHKSATRAGRVLSDVAQASEIKFGDDDPEFFIEHNAEGWNIEENKENKHKKQNAENYHPRRSYYRHSQNELTCINDGLFSIQNKYFMEEIENINAESLFFIQKIKKIRSAMFIPIELYSIGKSILCFYSYKKREYDSEFYAKYLQVMALLRQSFNFTMPGISFRLISEVDQILTEAAGSGMDEARLCQALSLIPPMMAKFLHCRDVAIKFKDEGGMEKKLFFTCDDRDESFISFIDHAFVSASPILQMNPVGDFSQPPPVSDVSLSRLAVPILLNGQVLAVIACQRREGPPYVLTAWERDLLAIVASHIARAWSEVQAKRRLENERNAWKQAVSMIAAANARGYRALGRDDPDLKNILMQMLSVVKRVIGGGKNECWLSIRLRQEDETQLVHSAFAGAHCDDQSTRMARVYSIAPDVNGRLCLGAWAVRNRKYWHCKNITSKGELPDGVDADDAGDKQFIVVPILAGNKEKQPQCLGVVDIHMPETFTVPDHFPELATVIGHQIGLFILMTRKVKSIVDDSEMVKIRFREANEYRRINLEVMQNIHHQVDSPMVIAMKEIDRMLDHFRPRISEFNQLRSIRAFVKRSWQASSSSDILRALTSGRLTGRMFDVRPMKAGEIALILQDLAEDFRYFIDKDKHIRIEVDTENFNGRDLSRFYYNEKLLNQVIGNLMDNAAKYSFENGRIYISGGLTTSANFYLSIKNKGIPIRSGESSKIKERGYRSEAAKYYAEGTGIGLWLVDQIMQHLGGYLEIRPALTEKEYHDFRLIFTPKKENA